MNEPLDLARLRHEIDAEVRARRASGDYPPGFERELDAIFARYAPPAASDDIEVLIDEAEEAAGIELAIPTESDKRGGAIVKQVLAKVFGWYHGFLVQQLVKFAGSVVGALRVMGDHVETLERATGHTARAYNEATELPAASTDAEWTARVIDVLKGTTGRVLVAEVGDGELLAALGAAGVDAYGVEPRLAAADAAAERGLEVRPDDVVTHLRAVKPHELAAAVLVHLVDRSTAGGLLEVVDLVVDRLNKGATLVVLSAGAASPARGAAAVAADLAPGRPLHPETWTHLLEARGFETVSIAEAPTAFEPVPGDTVQSKVINENLARLFGSGAYLLVARSPAPHG